MKDKFHLSPCHPLASLAYVGVYSVRIAQQKSRFLISLQNKVVLIMTEICTLSLLAPFCFLTEADKNRKKKTKNTRYLGLRVADE